MERAEVQAGGSSVRCGKDKTAVEESSYEDQKRPQPGKEAAEDLESVPGLGKLYTLKGHGIPGLMRASVGLGVWFSGKWGKRSHCKAADGQKENKSRSGRLMRSPILF